MGTQQVDWKQPIKLRGGGEIRLMGHVEYGAKPVIGVYNANDEWVPLSWDLNGRYRTDGKPSGLDIVNEVADAVA